VCRKHGPDALPPESLAPLLELPESQPEPTPATQPEPLVAQSTSHRSESGARSARRNEPPQRAGVLLALGANQARGALDEADDDLVALVTLAFGLHALVVRGPAGSGR
jgi:hypothetical protein